MFQSLADKLENAFKKFKGKGKLTESDVKEGMREIKLALLEADVNFKVVKEFMATVSERCVGAEVLESLTPTQHIVKIVNEELTRLMGGSVSKLQISSKPPTVVLMAGLQGAGKTTNCGKLAGLYKQKGKRPLLVACDIYRPAAIRQLQVVGEQLGIPVFTMPQGTPPVEIARKALEHAERYAHDMVFIDTAGRLHIDESMMQEIKDIKDAIHPTEILLVVDAMLGQDAVNVAKSFNDLLDITGVIMSKMDGDTRGGAALSVKYVTGKPIKFIGTGEKLDAIEPFYPDRMASRILGMGDVLSLIERAEAAYDDKQAEALEKKLREQTFDLEDYLEQFRQIKKMGSLENILGMLPGLGSKMKDVHVDERQIERMKAIILSMTPAERHKPEILNAGRRKRIAAGAGVQVQDVNRLIKQFEDTRRLMKELTGSKNGKRLQKRLGKNFR